MARIHAAAVLVLLMAVMVLPLGCASTQQAPAADNRLDFDPTDEYVLFEWWSNGAQLFLLRANGGYELYDGMNRYRTPRERGRWTQTSFATITLEPYMAGDTRVERIEIAMFDNELVLVIRDMAPFFGLRHPPVVLEDRLLGQWNSPMGQLALNSRMGYQLLVTSGDSRASGSGHAGRWELRGETLTLRPDDRLIDPVTLQVRVEPGPLELRTTSDGTVWRRPPPPSEE